MTVLTDDYRSKLQTLAEVQAEVNQWPKSDIVDLDLPDFGLACRAFKSQSYGSLGERWVCKRLDLTRVTGNKDYDAVSSTGLRYEIKFTIAGPGRKFNVVQVRPHAKLDAYLIFGINYDGTGQIWHLNKMEMADECMTLKAGSAHGKMNHKNPAQELRFTFTEDDETWERWKMYRLTPRGW